MTRCAASVLNSRVNFLLVTGMGTSFQPPHRGDPLGVHFSWGVSLLIVEAALKRKCNAIVLGSLRLRGLQSMIGHGTRERVLKMSSLPVIVTPPALCVSGPSRARL